MRVHLIVDFMYLYYKYKYTIDSNRIKRLTADVEWILKNGHKEFVKTDISYVYYPLREIEGFRRKFEKEDHDVTMSICFDAISTRKIENAEYKSNRTKKLSGDDFGQIALIRQLLGLARYNVYWLTNKYGLYSNKSKDDIDTFIISKGAYNILDSIGALDNISSNKIITTESTAEAFDLMNNNKNEMMGVICEAGYNCGYDMLESIDTPYGHEADDIIANLLRLYKDRFDFNIIYTPDTDLLVNIGENVAVSRYKAGKSYTAVGVNNFNMYCTQEYSCEIPYNAIMLYKCCVGDKSDAIKGIHNFGNKAFSKLVDYLNKKGIDWSTLGNYENTEAALGMCGGLLSEHQLVQARSCLDMVKPIIIDGRIEEPTRKSTRESRGGAYSKLSLMSLVD